MFFLSHLIDIHSSNIRKKEKLNRFPARFHYNQKVLRKSSQFFILKTVELLGACRLDLLVSRRYQVCFVFKPRPWLAYLNWNSRHDPIFYYLVRLKISNYWTRILPVFLFSTEPCMESPMKAKSYLPDSIYILPCNSDDRIQMLILL